MITVNPAGWKFVWPDGSDYIEVYHPNAEYPEAPVLVMETAGVRHNESELKRIANESPEYGRPYNEST